MRDDHTDCPCNGVFLCGRGNTSGCHGWAHGNPLMARQSGLIVSQHAAEPGSVPVQSMVHGGLVLLNCDGTFQHAT